MRRVPATGAAGTRCAALRALACGDRHALVAEEMREPHQRPLEEDTIDVLDELRRERDVVRKERSDGCLILCDVAVRLLQMLEEGERWRRAVLEQDSLEHLPEIS